jgi:hypothetical protein
LEIEISPLKPRLGTYCNNNTFDYSIKEDEDSNYVDTEDTSEFSFDEDGTTPTLVENEKEEENQTLISEEKEENQESTESLSNINKFTNRYETEEINQLNPEDEKNDYEQSNSSETEINEEE